MTLSGAKDPHNTFMIYRPYDSGGFLEPKECLSKTLKLLFHTGTSAMDTRTEQGHFEIEEFVESRYASSPAPSWGGIPSPEPALSPAPSKGLSSPAGSEFGHPPSPAQPSPFQPKSLYPAKYAAFKQMPSSASTAQYASGLDITGLFACIFHLTPLIMRAAYLTPGFRLKGRGGHCPPPPRKMNPWTLLVFVGIKQSSIDSYKELVWTP